MPVSVPFNKWKDGGLASCFCKLKKGLSLRSVDIQDGVPNLHFTDAKGVSTITEEDVATCVRLCLDGKRPEFFYKSFLPGHPFSVTGRHYMQYKPSYLKGTSVGELLAEVDWIMKCLHVGVRSDKNKSKFSSWAESSKLPDLKTLKDFPDNFKGSSSVFMTCELVEVDKEEDALSFVGEPKMKIDWFDEESSSPYTEYITDKFDEIAHHDEPDFLKMKEIVKLMLAVEWLKDQGVKFSEGWVKKRTKPKRKTSKPLAVELSEEEYEGCMLQLQKEFEANKAIFPSIPELPSQYSSRISLKEPEKKIFKNGFQLKLEITTPCPVFEALTGLYVPLDAKVTLRATVNDFDMLCEDLDPNQPVTIDSDSKDLDRNQLATINSDSIQLVIPQVKSWSDLYCNTMPFPCRWEQHPTDPNLRTPPITGGITTNNIPVHQRSKDKGPTHVSTSTCIPRAAPPACKPVKKEAEMFGFSTSASRCGSTSGCEYTVKQPSLMVRADIETTIGGETVREGTTFVNFPLPVATDPKGKDAGKLCVAQDETLLPLPPRSERALVLCTEHGEVYEDGVLETLLPLPPRSERALVLCTEHGEVHEDGVLETLLPLPPRSERALVLCTEHGEVHEVNDQVFPCSRYRLG